MYLLLFQVRSLEVCRKEFSSGHILAELMLTLNGCTQFNFCFMDMMTHNLKEMLETLGSNKLQVTFDYTFLCVKGFKYV